MQIFHVRLNALYFCTNFVKLSFTITFKALFYIDSISVNNVKNDTESVVQYTCTF